MCRESVLENDFSCFSISGINLSTGPSSDDFGDSIFVEVKGMEADGLVLGLERGGREGGREERNMLLTSAVH